MVHVDDVAAAYVAAMLREPNGAHVFNLNGATVSCEEIAAEINRQVPGDLIGVDGPRLLLPPQLPPDDIDRVLPGLPNTSLAEGISRTIAFYREREA